MNRSHISAASSVAPALAVLLCCLGLAACGGSSTATTTTKASPTNPAGPSGGAGANATRFGAVRECLRKQGITVPQAPAGSAQPLQPPKGVTPAQFQAALKKCVGSLPGSQGLLKGSSGRIQALRSFAACMRSNGVNLPPPDTSGKGPIFNIRGLDTGSATFRAARTKCTKLLNGLFGIGRPGASGPSGQ